MSKKIKALYLSDIHLGSDFSNCKELDEYFNRYDPEELYLIGDIFDFYAIKRKIKWSDCYMALASRLWGFFLKKGGKLAPGNHDECLKAYEGLNINGLEISKEIVVDRGHFKVLLVHGDELESKITQCTYRMGGWLYHRLLYFNRFTKWLGFKYNFAFAAKRNIKKVTQFLNRFEESAINKAKAHDCQAVMCGHIHHPKISAEGDVAYLNTGDWVENNSAIVEEYDHTFYLDYYDPIGKEPQSWSPLK